MKFTRLVGRIFDQSLEFGFDVTSACLFFKNFQIDNITYACTHTRSSPGCCVLTLKGIFIAVIVFIFIVAILSGKDIIHCFVLDSFKTVGASVLHIRDYSVNQNITFSFFTWLSHIK